MIIDVETAVVLVIPEAQPLLEAAWAETGATGTSMPAHVTLLYPFVDDPDDGIVEELRFFFAGVDGFTLSFSGTGGFPEVVYLAPDPANECVELTDALARRWPGFPPYSGKFVEVVPHLTVVKTPDPQLRQRVCDAVLPRLPIRSTVDRASLWAQAGDDGWRCVAEFPLGPPEP